MAEVMGLADPILDLAVTPNRGDCLGVRGIARDLAAAGVGELLPLDTAPVAGPFESPIGVRLAFAPEAASACPYFAGRLIRGVRNAESPRWLQDRLLAGRVAADLGAGRYHQLSDARPQPAVARLRRRQARGRHPGSPRPFRRAAAGAERQGVRPRAGDDGGSGQRRCAGAGRRDRRRADRLHRDDDQRIRRIGAVRSGPYRNDRPDAERPVRRPLSLRARRRSDLGELGPGSRDAADPRHVRRRAVDRGCRRKPATSALSDRLSAEPGAHAGGVATDADKPTRVPAALGFAGEFTGETWAVEPPPWRNDIDEEACLVEEVVRLLGYDRIPAVPLPPRSSLPKPALSPLQRRRARVRGALASRGLIEAVTYSFISAEAAEPFGGAPERLQLVNPISAELDVMRSSLLPNLVLAAQRNADRGQRDAALFEVGPQYTGNRPEEQTMVAAAVRAGRSGHRHWAEAARCVDAFDAKADALAVLEAAGTRIEKLTVAAEAPGSFTLGARVC